MIGNSFRNVLNVIPKQTRLFGTSGAIYFNVSQNLKNGATKLGKGEKEELRAQRTQLKNLKAQLIKEKKEFSKLLAKLREESRKIKTKEKQRAQKEKEKVQAKKMKEDEKKLIAAATKPFRRLSAYNYFVKENVSSNTTLKEATNAWNQLTTGEKEAYQTRAEEHNEKQLQIYTPKPKAPPSGFAAYVKENYAPDGRSFGDINKELAAEWRSLSEEEKDRFKAPQYLKDAYLAELKEWTNKRVNLYKETKARNTILRV